MLSISGPTQKQLLKIEEGKLLILMGATWTDYWTLAHEDLKVEFIKDRIYIHSPANIEHEEIFGFLLTEIRNFLKKREIGKVFGSRFPIELIDGKRVEPDIVFLSNQAIAEGELTQTIFRGRPTWIIEIVSPSYREHDTIRKREEYKLLNVEEYWIIDPEFKQINVIKFKNKKVSMEKTITKGLLAPQLPGLDKIVINVDTLWESLSGLPHANN